MSLLATLNTRRTSKVLGDPAQPLPESGERGRVDSLLVAAGNAPFHYPAAEFHRATFSSNVPWRAYKLDSGNCRKLMKKLINSGDLSKVPAMLAATEFLIQVTWLPDRSSNSDELAEPAVALFEPGLRNMEHIAAAGAFAQSLLLAATDAGYRTYWSSGGPLRSQEIFKWLNISHSEILLGAIFLFPSSVGDADIKPGAQRETRGQLEDWSVWREVE